MSTEDRDLLAAVHRWARANGWTPSTRGWINASYEDEATIAVGHDEESVRVWRKGKSGLFPLCSTDYVVDGVGQAVDVLCVLGILPVEFSSAYWSGTQSVEEWFPLPLMPRLQWLRVFSAGIEVTA